MRQRTKAMPIYYMQYTSIDVIYAKSSERSVRGRGTPGTHKAGEDDVFFCDLPFGSFSPVAVPTEGTFAMGRRHTRQRVVVGEPRIARSTFPVNAQVVVSRKTPSSHTRNFVPFFVDFSSKWPGQLGRGQGHSALPLPRLSFENRDSRSSAEAELLMCLCVLLTGLALKADI